MPKLADDSSSDVGSDAEMQNVPVTSDVGATAHLNGDLNDDLDEAAPARTTKPEDNEDEDNDDGDNDDDDSEQEDEYVVEAIRGHSYIKNKLLYEIKWVGYSESENTMEPESNLLPHARDILAKYKETLDEIPPLVLKKTKSKQSLRREPSTEDSPAPPSKRQRKNGADRSTGEREETWTPSKEDWEPFVVRVDAVERGDDGQLLAYILFKNNKKTKVSMDKVYRHCPRPMLRFYEAHLKFN
ncbi:hypothetical protein, variant [Exophiala mesophila]|uniref:Chromo domain-containing protein n=1 Tax=Exophiala mesophila TaxID=212818 RepID=A0A0D1WMR7_EXOME|nr:hypothetical protein, variant [Exophiala mesophila]KIV90315.1 hypothetical protein, variant [Exophiala mesophila]